MGLSTIWNIGCFLGIAVVRGRCGGVLVVEPKTPPHILFVTEIPKDPYWICYSCDLNYDIGVFKLIKITGNSLAPEYNEGDYLVITTLAPVLRLLQPGDIVVFKHPVYGTMVKQIQSIDSQADEIFVVGTHPDSTDSRHFGPIPQSWLTGKVLWQIPKIG